MANTTATTVAQLYTDLVADLVPYFMNATLLPNSALIRNSINMVGETGGTVRFPISDIFTNAATVGEGNSIIAAATSTMTPTALASAAAREVAVRDAIAVAITVTMAIGTGCRQR